MSGLFPRINIFIAVKMYGVWFHITFVDASAYALHHNYRWADGCICNRAIISIIYE
jgi:hypothetical protein